MISATFIKLNQLLKREHKYFLHSIFNAILPLFLFLYKLLKKFNNFIFRAVVFNASKTFFLGEFNSNNNKYLLLLDQNDKLFSNYLYCFNNSYFSEFENILSKFRIKKKTLIEIGACAGHYTIPSIKKKLFSNAIVFEPNIDSFKLLEMNIYLNNLENKISAKNLAIGNKNSFLYINTIKNHSTDSYIKKNMRNAKKIKSISIDDLKIKNIKKNFYLIDTQGYELEVLEGMIKTLKKKPFVMIEYWPEGLKRYLKEFNKKYEYRNKFISYFKNYKNFYDLKKLEKKDISELNTTLEKCEKDKKFIDLLFMK